MELQKVIVWDLDNSISNGSHRSKYAEKKQWEEFNNACIGDTPIQATIELMKKQKEEGYLLYVFTGRDIGQQEVTENQFKEWGVPCDSLRMRRPEQKIPAAYLKAAWIKKYIVAEEGLEFVRAYDDDEKVLNYFEKKGFEAIDVKPIISEYELKNKKSKKMKLK